MPHYNGNIYIVGSMAIALHEEDQNKSISKCPNDLDIVLMGDGGTLGKAPRITGMKSDNQTATKGATFVNEDESLRVDIIQEKRPENIETKILNIKGLDVLCVNELKKFYREITTAWERDETEKEIAAEKLKILNELVDKKVSTETSRSPKSPVQPIPFSLF
tara:strand:+ start:64 stop:549 length:486 start_codon:yes stop_codon:yes gene_type:complete